MLPWILFTALLMVPGALNVLHGRNRRDASYDEILERISALESRNQDLSRAVLLQQVAMEEYRRSNGDSGVSKVRNHRNGPFPYHMGSHSSFSVGAVHNHPDYVNMCGFGELDVVMNGVHFRTRHNDYHLLMPSSKSGEYNAVEKIEFPEVPPAVLDAGTVDAQITEMREWFKAWQTGDTTKRDYRPYFKPVLCYMEGAWTEDKYRDMTEPFTSVRHKIQSKSWRDLQEANRFVSWTGDKDVDENIAHLPMTVVNVTNDGTPVMAQWNYRILCHPIQGGLNISELTLVDDVASRLSAEKSLADFAFTRAARFSINRPSENKVTFDAKRKLDEIMAEIPGKDNYGAKINDKFERKEKKSVITGGKLNAAYYHRSYEFHGLPVYRGFNDRNLFIAQTHQPRVTPVQAKVCLKEKGCRRYKKRVSVAIPLEVVFLTPLHAWNPYGIQYKGDFDSIEGQTVTAGGRDGGDTTETAYDGANSIKYYLTPTEFFDGPEIEFDFISDSPQINAGVLDPDGNVRNVTSSGPRILLPSIPGVGVVRTRYPVFPVHAEGNTAMKEVEALSQIVMDLKDNSEILNQAPVFESA